MAAEKLPLTPETLRQHALEIQEGYKLYLTDTLTLGGLRTMLLEAADQLDAAETQLTALRGEKERLEQENKSLQFIHGQTYAQAEANGRAQMLQECVVALKNRRWDIQHQAREIPDAASRLTELEDVLAMLDSWSAASPQTEPAKESR